MRQATQKVQQIYSPILKHDNMKNEKGFTLIELMLSITITAAMLGALALITSNTQKAVSYQRNSLGSEREVWQVFDLLEQDLVNRIQLQGAHFSWEKKPGNDTIAFYTNRPGNKRRVAVGERDASWVKYILQDDEESVNLYRGSEGLDFDKDYISVIQPSNPREYQSFEQTRERGDLDKIAVDNYISISDQILRFEVSAILSEEEARKRSSTKDPELEVEIGGEIKYLGKNIYSADPIRIENGIIDFNGLRGICVSIVTIDKKQIPLLKRTDSLDAINQLFPDAKNLITPAYRWGKTVESLDTLTAAGLPQPVAQSLKVYERIIWL